MKWKHWQNWLSGTSISWHLVRLLFEKWQDLGLILTLSASKETDFPIKLSPPALFATFWIWAIAKGKVTKDAFNRNQIAKQNQNQSKLDHVCCSFDFSDSTVKSYKYIFKARQITKYFFVKCCFRKTKQNKSDPQKYLLYNLFVEHQFFCFFLNSPWWLLKIEVSNSNPDNKKESNKDLQSIQLFANYKSCLVSSRNVSRLN